MLKQSILTATTALLFTLMASCQPPQSSFTGSWNGIISAGVELPIVFHIKKDEKNNWITTVDSPNQNAFGIPCDTTIITGNEIRIEIKKVQANFTGKLVNDSTINGEFFQGVGLPLTLEKEQTAKTSATDKKEIKRNYTASEVKIETTDVTLSGTLFENPSAGKKKAVLIIAGSGPTNRDGNSTMLPGKNNSLLDLADSLSENGIATLRYDKRGVGKSRMATGMGEEQMTITNMVDDAIAMHDWLKNNGFEEIYIAGHSEGSLIGMLAAAKTKPAGFISIAGAGRPADVILKKQLAGKISEASLDYFSKAIDSIKKGIIVSPPDPALAGLLRPSVQPYIRSWIAFDPVKEIQKLKCPVLIIQGDKDLQVSNADAVLLHTASKRSKLVVIPSMNHVLKTISSGSEQDNAKSYSDPSFSIAPELLPSIRNFILYPSK
jgi:uncharacterized protein